MITWNEARRIAPTLEAVQGWPDEIVVIDSGSTDETRDICRRHGGRVIERDWPGYGAQKNAVVDACRGEWILLIDADEVVTPELRKEIDAVLDDPAAADVYAIPRQHLVYGKRLRHALWSGEPRVSLFRRGTGRWADVEVHEGYETDRPVAKLQNVIDHYTYVDRAHRRWKLDRYTTLEAQKAMRLGERPRPFYSAARAVYGALHMYVWDLGFLDGLPGLEMALSSGYYVYLADRKLAKLHAANVLRSTKASEEGES
jgi:glycosyltransferase involved in cell wall biosynthesis